MIEMLIDSIRVSLMNYQRVVILKERNAERYLPIWIGPAEADAIAVKIQDLSVPRPMTHDLLANVIQTLGATISYILVNELRNDTFFAKIIFSMNGRNLELDSRPSDAIALALRTKSPIYADESVLDKAGIILDKETGKAIPVADTEDKKEKPGKPLDNDELNRLSAFRKFIDSLDLKDLDKGTPA